MINYCLCHKINILDILYLASASVYENVENKEENRSVLIVKYMLLIRITIIINEKTLLSAYVELENTNSGSNIKLSTWYSCVMLFSWDAHHTVL